MNWLEALGYEGTHIPLHVLVLRLLMAGLVGGAIGWERELHHRAAGLRTHILVAAAACLFALLGQEIYETMVADASQTARVDMLRIIEAVTVGVAFLGAGTIFKSNGTVRGLTTGAGMWLAGAVGVACGFGHYAIALVAGILAVVALALLKPIERRYKRPDEDGDPT